MVAGLVGLAAVSPQASFDFDGATPHLTVRFALLDSELAAAMFAQDQSRGPVGMDAYFSNVHFDGVLRGRTVPIDNQLKTGNFSGIPSGSMVLLRSYVGSRAVYSAAGVYALNHDPIARLDSLGWSQIYDAGSTRIFVPP